MSYNKLKPIEGNVKVPLCLDQRTMGYFTADLIIAFLITGGAPL